MLNIVIIEDEDAAADALETFLDRYAAEKSEELSHTRFRCTTDFISNYRGADIVFMDINIPNDIDGISAARRLRELDASVTLIFTTSFEQFAVKGYEVEAFDFIVKPIAYKDFAFRMSRAVKHVRKGKLDMVNIKTDGKLVIIPAKDIKYVEVIKHKLLFHTVNGIIESTGTLHETEAMLADKYFVRGNRYYIVNLWYVRGMEGSSVNVDGEWLTVSRPQKKDFLSAMNKYLTK